MAEPISFHSVLIANRGEIARRVIRSCRLLGLNTVAVHSDPDEHSLHVAEADMSVRLPGSAAADTYLRVESLIAAALAAGADAIHPGYGFLSESAEFARAVQAAGLVWIGPPADAIAAMGDKISAKKLMAAAGVPVLPELDPATVTAESLPVLVKAAAGGGGRGMRVVRSSTELADLVAAASGEALRSFGDGRVFCEPYLAAGHHLEVQLLADQHGTVWAVSERECSIQRRHQKVIEQAPSPLVERLTGLRRQLFEAACAAARAIDYRGAGTVEFIADDAGNFYFLEMNTRLQVEHPVTECITGLDLVQLQLQIAAGHRLGGESPPTRGHAIEARLYAEDPVHDWQPQAGTLRLLEIPDVDGCFSPVTGNGPAGSAIRVDAGVRDGSEVSTFYDPLLAKVICHADDPGTAARRLASVLAGSRIHGVVTNRDQLVRVLRDPQFLAGTANTATLERPELAAPLADEHAQRVCAIAAALADAAATRGGGPVPAGVPLGWRNVPSQPRRRSFDGSHGRHDVDYRFGRDGVTVYGGPAELSVLLVEPDRVVIERAGVRHVVSVARYPGLVCVDSSLGSVTLIPVERFAEPADAAATGSLLAPLPGSVLRLAVTVGEQVQPGQQLVWIEAMKMEHPVIAAAAGVVRALPVQPGQQVALGDVLVLMDPLPAGEAP